MPTPAQDLTLSDSAQNTAKTGKGNWNWEDHVQSRLIDKDGKTQDIAVQDFVEAGTVLIAAAPATIKEGAPFKAVPIGMIESAVVAHNKPLNRIFEIGSKISYIVPGRGMGNMQLSRVFFDGDSVLKSLYWGEVNNYREVGGVYQAAFAQDKIGTTDKFTNFSTKPWSKRLAIDLMHTFFDRAFGLVFYFCDSQKDTLGIMYFEGCMASSHSIGITAAANVITEGVAIDFVRARSLKILGEKTTMDDGAFSGHNPKGEMAFANQG